MEIKIIIVDTEPMVAHAIERLFIDTPYQFISAQSPEEGEALLQECNAAMVLVDLMQHPVNGFSFLMQVRQRFPGVARVLFSSHGEMAFLAQCIGEGAAHLFLAKPWNNGVLKKSIEHLLSVYMDAGKGSFENLVKASERLCPLPKGQLWNGLAGIGISIHEDLLDPYRAARILFAANALCADASIGTVSRARECLGDDGIHALMQSRLLQPNSAPSAECSSYQRLAVTRLAAFLQLSKLICVQPVAEAWPAAALLCDIEQGLLDGPSADWGASNVGGTLLMRLWNLPSEFGLAAAGMHNPAAVPCGESERAILICIHLAHLVAQSRLRNTTFEMKAECFQPLEISGGQLESIVKEVTGILCSGMSDTGGPHE